MPVAALKYVKKHAKKQDQSQLTQDLTNRSQITENSQETWLAVYEPVVSAGVTATPPDQYTARTATGLPVVGRTYSGRFCTSVQAVRTNESPYVFEVRVTYAAQTKPAGDPSYYNISLSKSTATRDETVTQDRLDLPLSNTVGDLLPKLPTQTLYDTVWTFNFTTKTVPSWGDIEGKTNSDTVNVTVDGVAINYTKGQMKCISATFRTSKTVLDSTSTPAVKQILYECELSFQCRKPKWVWKAPNEGFRGYNSMDQIDTFRDPEDNPNAAPRTEATKLELDGHARAHGSSILMLPDDAIGGAIPNGNRTYVADGAFELEHQTAFSGLLTPIQD